MEKIKAISFLEKRFSKINMDKFNRSKSQIFFQENPIKMQKNYKELLLDKMKEQSLEFNEQNKKKDFIKEINPKIISDFTTYLSQKKKKFDTLKLFKTPRVEVIKILLNETKSDKNIFNKTFSGNFLNSNEYKNMNETIIKGHEFSKNKSDYEINTYNSKKIQKKKIKKLPNKNKSINQKNSIEINTIQYYNNPSDSLNKINKNKNLYNQILLKFNEVQIKSYLNKYYPFEEEKLKLGLMPQIKPIPMSHQNKSNENLENEKLHSLEKKQVLYSIADIKSINRKLLFEDYKTIWIRNISNFLITPISRSEAPIVNYYDDKKGENKIILYGGKNVIRLGEIWECLIQKSERYGKRYKWKKIKLNGEIPCPRSGHTAKIYRNNIIIYGGIIDDEKQFKEDILIYDINEKKFSNDICTNKQNSIWRKFHIAEIIGQFMFIYGGIDENGNTISDPSTLDLYRMKWIYTKFSRKTYLPKRHYHCSCQVFSISKKYHPKFSLFKIHNEKSAYNVSNIQQEGIYIFGGIDEKGQCSNEIYIIKRGKPLQMIKQNCEGLPPSPRCQSSMNFFDKLNVIIIHGGRNEYDSNGPFFKDFYFLDVERMIWIKLESNDGIIEIYPRGSHSSCIVDNELIIFGGFNDKYFLKSDLVVCDLDIIESTHLLKKYKAKKFKKKDDDFFDFHNENYLNNMLGLSRSNLNGNFSNGNNQFLINKKKAKYVLINKHATTSKSFFEKFPEQKEMLIQRFNSVEKIKFLDSSKFSSNKENDNMFDKSEIRLFDNND